MHEHPDRDWTVDDLAREVGLSRSALHERFMQYLGDPPMRYLANWRILLGSRLLRESNRTVATVALEVGYESEAAFSRVQEDGRHAAGSLEKGAGQPINGGLNGPLIRPAR